MLFVLDFLLHFVRFTENVYTHYSQLVVVWHFHLPLKSQIVVFKFLFMYGLNKLDVNETVTCGGSHVYNTLLCWTELTRNSSFSPFCLVCLCRFIMSEETLGIRISFQSCPKFSSILFTSLAQFVPTSVRSHLWSDANFMLKAAIDNQGSTIRP